MVPPWQRESIYSGGFYSGLSDVLKCILVLAMTLRYKHIRRLSRMFLFRCPLSGVQDYIRSIKCSSENRRAYLAYWAKLLLPFWSMCCVFFICSCVLHFPATIRHTFQDEPFYGNVGGMELNERQNNKSVKHLLQRYCKCLFCSLYWCFFLNTSEHSS